jgi:hypothetical protein
MPTCEFGTAWRAVGGFVAIARRRIVTGDHRFVDPLAKLAVNAINRFYGTVRVFGTLSLRLE